MSRFIFIFSFIFLISFESSAEVGVATEYNVTMKKVELCTSLDCSNPTVIGEGTQEVDIASLNAGSDAAKFADTNGLPFGTTFQFLRVTLNRAFTMTGSVDVGGTTCYSDGSTNADATTLHTGSTSSGDLASTPLYISKLWILTPYLVLEGYQYKQNKTHALDISDWPKWLRWSTYYIFMILVSYYFTTEQSYLYFQF